eukprot:745857-Hanusia_phi.AAC.2
MDCNILDDAKNVGYTQISRRQILAVKSVQESQEAFSIRKGGAGKLRPIKESERFRESERDADPREKERWDPDEDAYLRRAGRASGATISCMMPRVINTCRGEGLSCSICVGSEGGR